MIVREKMLLSLKMTVQCADRQGRAAQLITFLNRYRDYCNQQLQKYLNQEKNKLKSVQF